MTKLDPGSLQSWAGHVITVLREAHQAVDEARARGDTTLDQQFLDGIRDRYDKAAAFGATHNNRLRDQDNGSHPGYSLTRWLQDLKEQVLLFTRNFTVQRTNNVSEHGAKAAKHHQARPAIGRNGRFPAFALSPYEGT